MGHFLATVNPEAAEAIGQEVTTSSLPPIGTAVRYYPRPMEGRGGRSEFFFLVTSHAPDGRIGGVAVFDCQDFRDVMPCFQRSENNPYPAWDWLGGAEAAPPQFVHDRSGAVTKQEMDAFREAIIRHQHWTADMMAADLSRHVGVRERLDAVEASRSFDADEIRRVEKDLASRMALIQAGVGELMHNLQIAINAQEAFAKLDARMAALEAAMVNEAVDPAPLTRGRPKGSKNKTPGTAKLKHKPRIRKVSTLTMEDVT
jgi:hypothetical protein